MNLAETMAIVPAIIPVDLQTGANNGDWISMKNFSHLTIVVFKAVGTSGDNPVITLAQAKDVAGTSSKALSIIDKVYQKQGTVLTATDVWTVVTQAAGSTYTPASSADKQGLYLIEIDEAQLDIANGFDCVQVSIPDVGSNAQLGCALYILSGARYAGATQAAAITD